MNKFELLIQDLGKILGFPLQAEKTYLCKLFIKNKIHLQIEYDEAYERIFITSIVFEIPPGKFREDVLIAALKANYIDSSLGFFSYVDGIQSLILQLYLPISITSALLATLLQQFTAKAIAWKEALESGNISQLVPTATSSFPSPMNLS